MHRAQKGGKGLGVWAFKRVNWSDRWGMGLANGGGATRKVREGNWRGIEKSRGVLEEPRR